MSTQQKFEGIYSKKKWRTIGTILKDGEIKRDQSWLAIHKSSKEEMVTYESEGLVVSINGSGTIETDHPHSQGAAQLAQYTIDQGGIIINGGRNSGVMAASSAVAKENSLGILFPEIQNEASQYGQQIMVNSPQPRVELLATCTPIIVVFRGGLGTLQVLMRAIVHIRNRKYHKEQAPQLVFVSNYWIGLLTTMMNLGTIPREFLAALNFFDAPDQITGKLDKIKI